MKIKYDNPQPTQKTCEEKSTMNFLSPTDNPWHSVFLLIQEKNFENAIAVMEKYFETGKTLIDPTLCRKLFSQVIGRCWNEELVALLYRNSELTAYTECDLLLSLIGTQEKSEKLSFLLGLGVDINAKNQHGNTFLHTASRKKDKTLRLALDAGADMHALNDLKQSPLHLAAISAIPLKSSSGMDAFNYLVERNPRLLEVSDFGWVHGIDGLGTLLASKGQLSDWLEKYAFNISKEVSTQLSNYRLLNIMQYENS